MNATRTAPRPPARSRAQPSPRWWSWGRLFYVGLAGCVLLAAVVTTFEFVGFRNDAAKLSTVQSLVCSQGGPGAAQLEAAYPGTCPLAEKVKASTDKQVTAPDVVPVIGPTGGVGPAGPAGAPGSSGVGRPGPPGSPGSPGVPGSPGRDGSPGSAGQNGQPGRNGLSVQGAQGDTGPAGPAGRDGKDGKDGEPGKTGADGPPGPPGPSCPSGTTLKPVTFLSGGSGYGCVSDDG